MDLNCIVKELDRLRELFLTGVMEEETYREVLQKIAEIILISQKRILAIYHIREENRVFLYQQEVQKLEEKELLVLADYPEALISCSENSKIDEILSNSSPQDEEMEKIAQESLREIADLIEEVKNSQPLEV